MRGQESKPVAEITLSDVEAWLASRNSAPSSARAERTRLSALFEFCIRRGWMQANPIDRLETIRSEDKVPAIFTANESEKLIRFCARDAVDVLPYVALGLFCGLRPDEAARMRWESIKLGDASVVVDAATSKVRRRRVVTMRSPAVAWLTLCKRDAGPVAPGRKTLFEFRKDAASVIGRPWPQDVLRHTCASHWLADAGDSARVAHELGNSVEILHRHYKALVSRDDAVRFWNIHP